MSREPEDQFRQFVATLFDESDIVEVRPIEIWTDAKDGHRCSRVLRRERRWLTTRELFSSYQALSLLNVDQRTNIFMGVNPRFRQGAGKEVRRSRLSLTVGRHGRRDSGSCSLAMP